MSSKKMILLKILGWSALGIAASATLILWFLWPQASIDNAQPALIDTKTVRLTDGGAITLVRPRVNGEDTGWFALDSGAQFTVVDTKIADRLGLPGLLRLRANRCMQATLSQGKTFQLGRLRIDNPILVIMDLSSVNNVLKKYGLELAGIAGFPVFNSTVVDITFRDKGNDRVALYDPADYELSRGEWNPMQILGRRAYISATFEGGREALFQLDTGKSGNLSFYASYPPTKDLAAGRDTTPRTNTTACGDTPELEGNLDWFMLANHKLEKIIVGFKIPGTFNANGVEGAAGSIGQGLLRRFHLILNYPEEKFSLIPP